MSTDDTEFVSRKRHSNALTILVALMAVAMLTMEGSRAAFSATTENNGNQFTAGTVTISDDDTGSVMFDVAAIVPAVPQVRCINVTYSGSATADVRLYATLNAAALAPYLMTAIDIGTGAAGGTTFDCSGFNRSATLSQGTLAGLATANANFATGLAGFDGATNPTTRSYRVTATLADDNAAQGLSASATLTWEAQNVS